VTWAFVLEPRGERETRLHVRARAAFPGGRARLHAAWIRPVHRVMQSVQLRRMAARVEGRLPRDDLRDILDGVAGIAIIKVGIVTPFLRRRRARWGCRCTPARHGYPGDELVPHPTWGWTHAVEIDAPVEEVWPWVAQLGVDRGGFYSYSWLENLVGCGVRNAETIHPA
jgi:hypothetical protein